MYLFRTNHFRFLFSYSVFSKTPFSFVIYSFSFVVLRDKEIYHNLNESEIEENPTYQESKIDDLRDDGEESNATSSESEIVDALIVNMAELLIYQPADQKVVFGREMTLKPMIQLTMSTQCTKNWT